MRFFDGNYLFNTPLAEPTGYFVALAGAFVVLFVACAFVYVRRAKLAPDNPVLRRFLRRVATAGMWYAGIALVFVVMRYGSIDFLAPRFWIYLILLSMIASAAYYVYDLSENYPLAVHQLEQSRIERKYRPMSRPASQPKQPRPKVRGKRKR